MSDAETQHGQPGMPNALASPMESGALFFEEGLNGPRICGGAVDVIDDSPSTSVWPGFPHAEEEVHIRAEKRLVLDSGVTLELRARDIRLVAESDLTLESATARLSGSARLGLHGGAIAELTGGLVKIN